MSEKKLSSMSYACYGGVMVLPIIISGSRSTNNQLHDGVNLYEIYYKICRNVFFVISIRTDKFRCPTFPVCRTNYKVYSAFSSFEIVCF